MRCPVNAFSPPIPRVASMFIVMLTVIFGANAVAIKLTLAGMGPLTTAGMRFSLAALAISCWALVTGRSFRIRHGQWRKLLIVSLGFTAQLALFYLGLHRTYASRGVLLANLLPFFVLFLSHRFIPGERITWTKLTGIVLGFSGVAFLFSGSWNPHGRMYTGDAIILMAVTIWSCNVVYTKRIIADFLPFHLVLYPMIVSVPVFMTAGALWDEKMIFDLNVKVLAAFFYQGLVSAAFGFVAWSTMLQRYGASTLHAYVFIMPIAGVLFSTLLLGEPLTSGLLVALTLIAAGIMIVHLEPKRSSFLWFLGRGW